MGSLTWETTRLTNSEGPVVSSEAAHLGNVRLLEDPLAALFRSSRCPGDVVLKVYDFARTLRDAIIGGFQTPMEKECLRLLLRGSQPVVVCPARGIGRIRIPRA